MNGTKKTIMNANLFSRLFDGLDDPARLAIEMLDGQRISYGELIALTGQMANVLVSRGVKTGDRVAAQTEKSVPGLVLYLATVRAGAVYLPLNTAYTLNELEYFIGDNVSFDLQGRYFWVNPINGTVDGQPQSVDLSSVLFTFGLRVYLFDL